MFEKAGKESQYNVSRLPLASPWWDEERGVTTALPSKKKVGIVGTMGLAPTTPTTPTSRSRPIEDHRMMAQSTGPIVFIYKSGPNIHPQPGRGIYRRDTISPGRLSSLKGIRMTSLNLNEYKSRT